MESTKMNKSLGDHLFGNGVDQKQEKWSAVYSSYSKLTGRVNDEASNVRPSDTLNPESSIRNFKHDEEPSSSRLEDRRRHYERQIHKVRGELLEEQRKLGLKVVNEGKNQALLQFQDAWCQFSPNWKELERRSDCLARKKQEEERKAIESAQSVMPFEYEYFESPVEQQECKKLYPAERDECVNNSKYRKYGAKQKHHNTDEFTNKTARKGRTENDKKSQFLTLLKEFGSVHEKCKILQRNSTRLKDEKQVFESKLMELNRDIGILEEQKKVLETTLVEYNEKQKYIQSEIKKLSNQMDKLKYELRKCKNSEDVHGAASQLSVNTIETPMENIQISEGKNNPSLKPCALEIQLLQDIHKEELQLYKSQLTQAAQQIRDLEAQLKVHNTKKDAIKKRHGSKHETQNRIKESNLVNDGTSNHRRRNIFDKENLPHGNHVSRDKMGNSFQLESTLKSLMLDQFVAFKEEMLNVIGDEVKQNVYSVHNRITTLENNVQEVISVVKTDAESSNIEDKQSYVDYIEGSSVCERRNTLDCGTGMAFNFFYGYLKLILPGGSSTQGLKRRILNYIIDERLSDNAFPMKKLIILIPQNTYTPTSLQELSIDDPSDGTKYWLESAKPLQPETIERNGWKRDFHLPVYRVKDPDSESGSGDYVVAEFATPVKVFSDIIHKCPVPKISEAFKVYQQEIISSFYKSLLERIEKNNDGCKDLCEIIYYPDTDKNGRRVNIGRIILDRIHSRNTSCYQ